jgi:hypothetical protein
MTSTLDNTFSTLVADLLFGQQRQSEHTDPEQLVYRRNLFRTIREYTTVIGNYNRNIESLIRLLQNTSPSNTNTLESVVENPPYSNNAMETDDTQTNHIHTTTNANPPRRATNTNQTNTETDTTYFSSSPYDSFRELNNITRLWGRPRHIPTDASSNPFTREFTYFFNFPLSTSREQSEGLTLEEVHRETSEATYDSSSFSTTQCPISFDEFQSGEPILQIRRCGHIFKPDELRRWLTRHTGCPVCRCDLQTAQQDEAETDYSDLPDLMSPDEV